MRKSRGVQKAGEGPSKILMALREYQMLSSVVAAVTAAGNLRCGVKMAVVRKYGEYEALCPINVSRKHYSKPILI